MNRGFSRRHYRLVSPPTDTQSEIGKRTATAAAAVLAAADREEAFPTIENALTAEAAIAYYEERLKYHLSKP